MGEKSIAELRQISKDHKKRVEESFKPSGVKVLAKDGKTTFIAPNRKKRRMYIKLSK